MLAAFGWVQRHSTCPLKLMFVSVAFELCRLATCMSNCRSIRVSAGLTADVGHQDRGAQV